MSQDAPEPGREPEPDPIDSLLSLPFDQYQRHRIVQETVDGIRDGRSPLRILDVGGAPGLLKRFLPRDRVLVADQEGEAGETDVRASGTRLPFPDRSFDVVVSVDALEHLPDGQRAAFVKELARITGDSLLITAPFAAPQVDEAESILAAFLEKRLNMDHRFLSEHREHGLPDQERIVRALEDHVGPVATIPNGNLHRWLLMMALSFYLDADGSLGHLKGEVSAYYNRHYYRMDNTEPAYRHLLVARRQPASLPSLTDLVPGQEDPVALDFSPMSVLMEATTVDLLKAAYGSIEELQTVRDQARARIEELQAEVEVRGKRMVAQQEMLDWLPIRVLRKLRSMLRG
jgi:hypothetical protein